MGPVLTGCTYPIATRFLPVPMGIPRRHAKLMGFFVGKVMKETGSKANPKLVNEIPRKFLGQPSERRAVRAISAGVDGYSIGAKVAA